jgi:hypothetical protein
MGLLRGAKRKKKEKKNPNMKFHENQSNGRRVVPYKRTDGHDGASSLFSQFCESA